jgi:hypothetical protein
MTGNYTIGFSVKGKQGSNLEVALTVFIIGFTVQVTRRWPAVA